MTSATIAVPPLTCRKRGHASHKRHQLHEHARTLKTLLKAQHQSYCKCKRWTIAMISKRYAHRSKRIGVCVICGRLQHQRRLCARFYGSMDTDVGRDSRAFAIATLLQLCARTSTGACRNTQRRPRQ
jgi:hypothetical protein